MSRAADTLNTVQTMPRLRQRAKPKIPWGNIGVLFALIVLAFLFLTPFIWLVSTSLKSLSDLAALPVRFLPAQPVWHNFLDALTMINYGQFTINSILLSTIYSSLTTLTCALVGFGFARLRGVGKHTLFLVMLSTLMLPPILTTIPTYVLFSRLGLVNTYWPWVLWGLASSPFLSFLFRQFFSSIPLELEEAAIIDGCSYGRLFWQIFLPLSRPVIATAVILSFTAVWGDWLTPSLFLNQDNTTLAVAMSAGYTSPHGEILTNTLSAGIIMYVLPVMLLFFFAQRYFVQGIVTSGLKG